MKYTLSNGKVVNIPDNEIEKNMKFLQVSKEEAIEIYLEDNDFSINEEQLELEEKAKKVKINHGAESNKPKQNKKPKTHIVSDEKQVLFNDILGFLSEKYGKNVQIVTQNKLLTVQIDEITFKIDLIQQRKPKK